MVVSSDGAQVSLFVPEVFRFLNSGCQLAIWCHTLNQILIKYDEKRYLCQFLPEMIDSLQ